MGGYGIVDGAASAPFGRLRAKSLADEVSTRLNDAIMKGLLRPGEKVVEAALSRQMDVSRAPIREAIKMLVERGLLVQVPRRGVFVREYSIREIKEINELRLAIEVGALSRAMTGGFLLQLDLLYDALDAPASVADDGGAVSGLEREFAIHRAIVQLYPNEHFIRAFDGIANELRVAIAGVRLKDVSEAQLRQDYGPLIRAIRTHDHDRAIGLLRDAVNEFAMRVLQGLGAPDSHSAEPSGRGRIAG